MPQHKNPSASYARILLRHLRLSREDSQEYFAGTDLSYDALMALDETASPEDLMQIYRNALTLSGQPHLGLAVGSQLHLSTHGPLGVATFSGPDLRSAITVIAKYSRIRIDFINFSVTESAQGMTVRCVETFDLQDLRAFITESVLSSLFAVIEHFAGAGQFGGWVYCAYPEPGYGQQYRDHFGPNITFDHSATEIFIPESLLSIPSPVADPALHQQSVAICEQHLSEFTTGEPGTARSVQETVAQLMSENPGRLWTLNEVAKKLHMSSRTLIRKLDAEGTKFQMVRDEVAKQQAIRYLSDGNLTVESIGHLLGFSDASSFRRSFKRWFGETPSEYIARDRNNPGGRPNPPARSR